MSSDVALPQELLDAQLRTLRDIQLPPPPLFISSTLGWWLLAGLLLLIIGLLIFSFIQRRRALTVAALEELTILYAGLGEAPSLNQQLAFAEGCKQLLKRRARSIYAEEQPDTLTGANWRAFLVRTGPGSPPPDTLVNAAYERNPNIVSEQIRGWVEGWLQQHKHAL